MPYKSLSSPRAVLDLGAEIRGAATLATPALVAMVSTDPVRLGVQPASGTGKVTPIALGTADDVALLSRDVAIVRSGDDVWALSDLAHSARTDQVARDARALIARPSGESALVLGWDGGATALTLGGNEVVPRPFAVRGTLRACDIDGSETFVLVDGPGGGELRIHPGGTPEPGASARCPLPSEAAALDAVRGGKELCIVYKAGRREVCIVHRAGAQATAALVELEVSPVDVVVSETSFFAVFADGRAALYDGATLRGAAGRSGELVATTAISLAPRGEPRTVRITGRATPSLWVGTSAGELLQVGVVRKSPV